MGKLYRYERCISVKLLKKSEKKPFLLNCCKLFEHTSIPAPLGGLARQGASKCLRTEC